MPLFLSGNYPTWIYALFCKHIKTIHHIKICRKTATRSQINSKSFSAGCNITVLVLINGSISSPQLRGSDDVIARAAAASGSQTHPRGERERCSVREAPVAPPQENKKRSQKCPTAQMRAAWTGSCDVFNFSVFSFRDRFLAVLTLVCVLIG